MATSAHPRRCAYVEPRTGSRCSFGRGRLRGYALVLLAVAAACVVAPAPLGAKEGVTATLTAPIPLDAAAGSQLRVTWRLFSVDDRGQRRPFGASGVFVRLRSPSGADVEEASAPGDGRATGEYEATVTVPEGGIGDVELGLMGWQSGPSGTRRADLIFPITNDPLTRTARTAAPGSTSASDARARPASAAPLLVAGMLAVFALLAAGLALRSRRGRSTLAA